MLEIALVLPAPPSKPFMKATSPLIFFLLAAAAIGPLTATAHEVIYTASLSGPNASPPNASPGTGFVTLTVDLDVFTLRVEANFSDLEGPTTAAHIHAATATPFTGTAGVATQMPSFEFFPLGVTSGAYDHTFDLTLASSYNPAFIAANGGTISTASNALFAALNQGRAYFDIHTAAFDEGEIRGFLVRQPPTPKSVVSRKAHGTSGDFDVDLPLPPATGIESRSGGANGDYQVVFNFKDAVTLTSAAVTTGAGSVADTAGNGTPTITVNLTGVTNAQRITITLSNVSEGTTVADLSVQMGVLAGDTNGDGVVNTGDALQTRTRAGQATEATNFRSDVNGDGFVNSGDTIAVRSGSGMFLP